MPTNEKILAVIPARWASVRFPGKPLTDILGKPMVQWVSEQVQKASLVTEVVIATDDKRIYDVVVEFDGRELNQEQFNYLTQLPEILSNDEDGLKGLIFKVFPSIYMPSGDTLTVLSRFIVVTTVSLT